MWNALKIMLSLAILASLSVRAADWLSTPGAAETETEPRSVFGDRLVAVSPGKPHSVTLKDPNGGWDYWLFRIGEDAIELGKWMAKDSQRTPAGDVQIVIESQLSDRYGKAFVSPTFGIRWTLDDWSKVEWGSISPDQMIALGDMRLAFPAVRQGIVAWCQRNQQRRWPDCASTPRATP